MSVSNLFQLQILPSFPSIQESVAKEVWGIPKISWRGKVSLALSQATAAGFLSFDKCYCYFDFLCDRSKTSGLWLVLLCVEYKPLDGSGLFSSINKSYIKSYTYIFPPLVNNLLVIGEQTKPKIQPCPYYPQLLSSCELGGSREASAVAVRNQGTGTGTGTAELFRYRMGCQWPSRVTEPCPTYGGRLQLTLDCSHSL